jgi:hypothetical protein
MRLDWTQREVDAAPHEHRRDECIEEGIRDVVCDECADDRADHGGKRDPRDHAPVDAPFARVSKAACARGGRGDRDVRPRGDERASRREDDERQPQRPEDETEHRPQISRDECGCER